MKAEPGKAERYDYSSERNGVSNLFIFFGPLAGWHHVDGTSQRTAIDWAYQISFAYFSQPANQPPSYLQFLCCFLRPFNLIIHLLFSGYIINN
ncbi:MAG: hypothetical protein VSS75_033060 [Candidatus Parabeggiatoa sp.]|nr:hypothetical protein [Candidatus Parabeggiatoa sp.]